MAPPHTDMNGTLLRLVTRDTKGSVAMLTTERDNKFGIRLDFITMIQEHKITVQMVCLDKEEILRIKKIDAPDAQFELAL